MKNFQNIIIFSVFILLSSCTAYKEVEMLGVQNYALEKVNTDKIAINLSIKINNPNSYNIKVKKSFLDFFIEGKKIGVVNMQDDIIVQKRTEKYYTIVVEADYKDISNNLFSILPSAIFKENLKVEAKGKLKAKALGVVGKKFDFEFEKNMKVSELKKLAGFNSGE